MQKYLLLGLLQPQLSDPQMHLHNNNTLPTPRRNPTSSSTQHNTRQRASYSYFNTVPASPSATTPYIEDNTTLFPLLTDSVFDSMIRPCTRKILSANRRRYPEVFSDT